MPNIRPTLVGITPLKRNIYIERENYLVVLLVLVNKMTTVYMLYVYYLVHRCPPV